MPAQLRHVAACALPPGCGWRRFGCRTSLDGCIPGTPGTPSHRRDIPPSGWISSFPVWDVGSSIGTGTVRNRTSSVCPASAVQPAFHSLGKIRSPQPRGIPALLSGPTALPPSSVRSCMKKATPKSRLSFSCCEFINFSGIQWVLRKHHRCVGRHSHRFPSAPSEKMGHSSCRYLSFSPESLSSLHLHR